MAARRPYLAVARCLDEERCGCHTVALITPVRGGWIVECGLCGHRAPYRAPGPTRRLPADNRRLARYSPPLTRAA